MVSWDDRKYIIYYLILKNMKKALKIIVWVLLFLVILFLIVTAFIFKTFQMTGYSMSNTLYDKQYILVNKIRKIHRWDIVAISIDKNKYIKRIIAIPWDSLKIENWEVFLKKSWETTFVQLDEQYLNTENKWATFIWYNWKEGKIYELWQNDYFLMGDNRNHSTDSRECFWNCMSRNEFLQKEDIVWRVFFDLGYFNTSSMSFTHPKLWVSTIPKFFNIY